MVIKRPFDFIIIIRCHGEPLDAIMVAIIITKKTKIPLIPILNPHPYSLSRSLFRCSASSICVIDVAKCGPADCLCDQFATARIITITMVASPNQQITIWSASFIMFLSLVYPYYILDNELRDCCSQQTTS